MARPRSAPDPYLLGKVSTLYYLRDETQQSIAERLSLSRPTVSRLLREARALGLVRISVAAPGGLHLELESRLEERYRLDSAHVVEADPGSDGEALRRALGAAAADHLARAVHPNDRIGMAWGSTLAAMVAAMAPLPVEGARVVQILGGLGPPDAADHAAALVRQLAKLLDARAVPLPAPGVVASAAVRDALHQDPHVAAALREVQSLNLMFVGVGSLASNAVLNDGHSVTAEERDELRARGAEADVALRFFDADGSPVRTGLDDRILGITTEQLRGPARVVAVAGGAEKVAAIASALRSGVLNVLITDRATADALIAHPE
jgi:DNA-binding transcriptional regulator LsrR (DeoR family)